MKRKATKILLAIAFICSLSVISTTAYSQVKITTAILDPIWVLPDTIISINEADITGSAEATSAILTDILSRLPDSAIMAGYENRLITILQGLDTLNKEFIKYEGMEIGAKAVQNYKNELKLLLTEKDKLKIDLEGSTNKLQGYYTKINYLEQIWKATLASADGGAISATLKDRIAQVTNEVKSANELVINNGEAVISLSDRLLTGGQLLEELSIQVTDAEEQFQLKYLSKTHRAIWERDTLSEEESINPSIIFTSVHQAYAKGISQFYNLYKVLIYFHLFLFIVLLTLTIIIKRRLKGKEIETDSKRIQTFLRVFMRPIALSLLLALFLTFLLYPAAPLVITELASYFIIIPLIIIARQVLPSQWYKLLYLASGFFIFVELIETVQFESYPLPMVTILIATIAAIAYVIWRITRRVRMAKKRADGKFTLIDVGLWIIASNLFISIIANITGYVSFGFFLFRGVVISVIAGLLISVTVTVIEGFFTLIIMGQSSQMYEVVRDYGNKLVNNIIRVVKFFALVYWLQIVLRRFLIYDSILDWLIGILETKWVINDITISVEGILLFGLIIFLSIWLSGFIKLLLEKEIFPRLKFSRGIPGIISLIIRFSIVTIGFLLSLGVLGIKLDNLTILMGALGVGIGFGLQDIMNNLISGFILIFGRPIQVGDIIQFGDKEGIVKEIGIRASNIKTYNGAEVIVPNGKLISNELVNLTLSDHMARVEINIGTEYGSDPQEVIDILVMQAKLHDKVSKNPEAFAIFFGYGDYALNFRLYAYTTHVNSRLSIRSDLNLAIFQALKEAEIQIPFPIQDLNVKIENEKEKKEKKPKKIEKEEGKKKD